MICTIVEQVFRSSGSCGNRFPLAAPSSNLLLLLAAVTYTRRSTSGLIAPESLNTVRCKRADVYEKHANLRID